MQAKDAALGAGQLNASSKRLLGHDVLVPAKEKSTWLHLFCWWSGSNEAPPSALLHERQFNLVRYSQTKTGTGYIPAHTISIRETAGKGSYFTNSD